MAARNKPNEIHLTRVYDAPAAVVWDAFTDPDQCARWWGPRGFTLTTHSKDLRPGGHWTYTMHGPDGVDYPNKALYHEVEKHRKLVYDHGANDDRPPLFRVTVLFSELDGETTMEMTMSLSSAEKAAATRRFIKEAGGNSTWDRLAEYLDETRNGRDSFVINHSFAAPIGVMFGMSTDPSHLVRWLPPAGFDMTVLRANIETGGDCFFRMSNGEGVAFYGRFDYREIVEPRRIVYVQQFCDEAENAVRHPGMPEFPATMETTVMFAPEGDRATRVAVVTEICGEASAGEIEAFRRERPGMTLGWSGSFDSLEEALAATPERLVQA
jgi:uncharacterized protein YndB with AHSA1/START domain